MSKIKTIFTTAFFFLLTGCSDFLDEKVYTQITTDYLVNSPEGMSQAVVAMYNRDRELIRSQADPNSVVWTSMIRGTDISVSRAGDGHDEFSNYEKLDGSLKWLQIFWKHHYYIIGCANQVIESEKNVDPTSPIVKQALAEARCFRAHAYYHLLHRFDRILLVTKATTPDNIDDKVEYKPAEPTEVYKLINEDLEYAINNLNWTSTEPGRFTQGFARHLRAKTAMWQKDWDEAIKQVDTTIEKGPYGLVALNEIFGGTNLIHKEVILSSQWSRSPGGNNDQGGGKMYGHRMGIYFIPRYYDVPGMKATIEDGGGNKFARIYPNEYLLSLYDENKDQRYHSFYKHYWKYNNPKTLPKDKMIGDIVTLDDISTNNKEEYYLSNLHPACLKFWDKWNQAVDENLSYQDIIIYRLAETYLLGSEAYMRKYSGDHKKAKEYYNETWVRAGNDEYKGTITEDLILEEHARELAFENDRWLILKRMGKLVERVQLHTGEGTYIKGRTNIKPYHVRWPIPQTEIDNMGKENFPQNEMYN